MGRKAHGAQGFLLCHRVSDRTTRRAARTVKLLLCPRGRSPSRLRTLASPAPPTTSGSRLAAPRLLLNPPKAVRCPRLSPVIRFVAAHPPLLQTLTLAPGAVAPEANAFFCFGSMVNARPFIMGGIIEYGVGIGTKSSPQTQAIEKAQKELRQKCDVREEHRRELEFLEKGGNPLDFEFTHVTTASVPSTSLTNKKSEQNVTSEAKGSFAASPHGDSLESNDRPGSSLHETNTTDGGGKSDIVEDKIVKKRTKRNAAQPKQSLSTDSNRSARKTEDSGLSHLVVKSQAYVRRNRSKPTRESESANVSSVRSSVTPAKGSEPRDEKGVVQRRRSNEPVCSVKPSGSYSDNAPKTTTSDHQVTMELNGFQNVHESNCLVKNELKAEEVASAETPGANSKVFVRPCNSSASTCDERESSAGDEKADESLLDKHVGDIHVSELDKSRVVPSCAIEDSGIHKNTVVPLCQGTRIIVDDHVTADINLVVTKVGGKSHEGLENSSHSNKTLNKGGQTEGLIGPTSVEVNMDPVQPESSNIWVVKDVMGACDNAIVAQKDTGCPSSGHDMNIEESAASDRKNDSCPSDPISARPTVVGTDLPKNFVPDAIPSLKGDEPNMENEIKKSENLDKMAKKAYEDSILLNARTIEASIKRAGERLLCNISLEKRRKSHWDFVLEEMAWMANDFVQERLWKRVAAAQMCHWIASDGRAKFEEATIQRKQKTIMKCLANGIKSFWYSVEASQTARRAAIMQEHNSTMLEKTKASGIEAGKEHENLFYTAPTGAMRVYRESVESLFEHHKLVVFTAALVVDIKEIYPRYLFQRAGNAELMDEYEASACDSAADFPREDTYGEDEGETCTYLSSEAYEGGFTSKMCHKKKHQMHQRISGGRQYEIGLDVPYEPCFESKSANRPMLPNGKRSSSFLAVPAKRNRTAARQRVVSPFHGATGASHAICKTDASSGDTNSLQDDERSLHGGSLQWRNLDYESTVDFDGQLPYDAAEVSTKANKKKKLTNPGYKTAQNTANSRAPATVKSHMYDQRLQFEDYLKKRPEMHQYMSNGICVTNGVQHASKKLKMMKQGIDNSPAAFRVASQMSNMANSARFIKIIANRERGKKCKALKMTSIDGWSNFEDQALVVLVHDVGQNWELVSDAINSIVRFKSVHRQPNECKERHKVLVDRSSCDGADSAEDSGSSQRYHNSLPGIPKACSSTTLCLGNLLLCGMVVQGSYLNDFKDHSRKRISRNILKKLYYSCNKYIPDIDRPLDLCDSMSPHLDSITPGTLSLGSQINGLTLPNHQGFSGPATPTSNLSSRLPGAPGMVLGNNVPSSSTWNTHRDSQKYGVPGLTSVQGDEQPKIQYNQVVSGRNFKQPGGSFPGVLPTGIDRSGRAMPGAQMAGLNRGMSAAKAGSPRISAPGGLAVSSGNLVPNSGQGVPSSVNFHPGGVSGPGNSISRPRDPVQILHPGHSMEEHKQVPDMHMQVPHGSSYTGHVNCINPSFSNIAMSPPVQQPQQPHLMSQSSHIFGNSDHSQIQETSASPQQRAYALHLPKERQTQQHMVPQQNSDTSGASAVSCVQTTPHIVQQNQRSAVNSVPCSQPQHQRQQAPQNSPDASSSPNLPASASLQKQKKQQGHHQSRQNLQQRNQGSQQAKLMKSLGRGNMVTPQTPPVDNMPANAISTPSKKHMTDKKLMQNGQAFSPDNTASTPSTLQPINQPKLYTMSPQSLKQLPDIGNQSGVQASSSQTLSDSLPSPIHSKSTMTTQQQQIIPSQSDIQRKLMQQNCQMSSECRTDTHHEQVQHNQMAPATSVPLSTDSGSPLLSSVNQLKFEAHNPASVALSSNLLSSPRNTSFGNDTLLPSSGQDLLQRQISGSFPMHDQVVGQWNQQARQQPQSQHPQTSIVQGSAYAPSNSGSG
ncbi:hypothetical protein PR202_gb09641 [Eleusine coracana subsp. coracana]|uniref:Chromatin modification-related protein EAF1 B n=1 Tax=Eleusine coracana subsp. coracana TaxID=191504 RepID=A0AAV5EIK7_ELECO|nr:hypothetical protein PR202_gb09641 [Eleusine coracana subsp. coracana]